SRKRQHVIEPSVRGFYAAIGDVAEADSGIQRPSCRQIVRHARTAPDQKIEIRPLFGNTSAEISPEWTAAAFKIGLQPAVGGERINGLRREPRAIGASRFRDP